MATMSCPRLRADLLAPLIVDSMDSLPVSRSTSIPGRVLAGGPELAVGGLLPSRLDTGPGASGIMLPIAWATAVSRSTSIPARVLAGGPELAVGGFLPSRLDPAKNDKENDRV